MPGKIGLGRARPTVACGDSDEVEMVQSTAAESSFRMSGSVGHLKAEFCTVNTG